MYTFCQRDDQSMPSNRCQTHAGASKRFFHALCCHFFSPSFAAFVFASTFFSSIYYFEFGLWLWCGFCLAKVVTGTVGSRSNETHQILFEICFCHLKAYGWAVGCGGWIISYYHFQLIFGRKIYGRIDSTKCNNDLRSDILRHLLLFSQPVENNITPVPSEKLIRHWKSIHLNSAESVSAQVSMCESFYIQIRNLLLFQRTVGKHTIFKALDISRADILFYFLFKKQIETFQISPPVRRPCLLDEFQRSIMESNNGFSSDDGSSRFQG